MERFRIEVAEEVLEDLRERLARTRFPDQIERAGFTQGRIEVPAGCANFPKELYKPPRQWVERHYNVTRWTEMEIGGHFAALEQPALLVDDIRAFFRELG